MNRNRIAAAVGLVLLLAIGLGVHLSMRGREIANEDAAAIAREIAAVEAYLPGERTPEPTQTPNVTQPPPPPEFAAEEEDPPIPSPTPPAERDFTLWLTGTVSDTEGAPLPGIDIVVTRKRLEAPTGNGGSGNPSLTRLISEDDTQTDENGYYEVALAGAFPYVVYTKSDGYSVASASLFEGRIRIDTNKEGKRIIRQDFTLSETSEFKGRVVNEEGEPVSGAAVIARVKASTGQVFDHTTLEVRGASREDGTFALNVGAGQFRLRLSKEGYVTSEHNVEKISEVRDWELPEIGGEISGVVKWEETGEPVPNATVTAYVGLPSNYFNPDPLSISTTSNEDGEYLLSPLSAGKWDVVASLGDEQLESVPPSTTREITLGEVEIVRGIELTLPKQRVIHGLVMDVETEEPIEGVLAYISTPGYRRHNVVYTDKEGKFEMAVSTSPSQWDDIRQRLHVEKEGYLPVYGSDGEQLNLSGYLMGERFLMTRIETVDLSGQVTWPDGRPASNIYIEVYQAKYEGSRGFTDATGFFRIPVMINSEVNLEARPPEGPSTYAGPYTIEEKDLRGANFILDPGGDLRVTAVNPDGEPVENTTIGMMRRTYRERSSSASHYDTKDAGQGSSVVFEDLPSTDAQLEPGLERASVDVFAWNDDYERVEETGVQINPGVINEHTITLLEKDSSGVLAGTVSDGEGNTIEGVAIQVSLRDSTAEVWERSETDPLGYFRIEGIRPGEYHVRFDHPEYLIHSEMMEAPNEEISITLRGKEE